MRVGLVAKGLLLKGDLDLELVLLCKDKPTSDLLEKVADNLGVQLAVSKTFLRTSKTRFETLKTAGGVCFQTLLFVALLWKRLLNPTSLY